MNNVTIIYTPWSNLKKSPGLETGQVTFHKQNLVKKVYIEKRVNEIVNRLNKTKVESQPDLAAEKIAKQREDRNAQRLAEKKKTGLFELTRPEQKQEDMAKIKERQQAAEMRSYQSIMDETQMKSNRYQEEDLEESFM
ncbi:hypothetical protein HDU76_003063 [Blyttiomyces sp. JEL0837]|nr:hypothetical protein HDU76_003063 [Blyttiomyces sp. JEL0837]